MTVNRLTWMLTIKNLRWRSRKLILSLGALAICNMLVLSLVHFSRLVEVRVDNLSRQYDLVIGGHASPMMLVWQSLTLDVQTASPPVPGHYEDILWDIPEVDLVLPVATGESHRVWPVIGTVPHMLENYAFGSVAMKDGEVFGDVSGVVLGADVAKESGYKVGEFITIGAGSDLQPDDVYSMEFPITGIIKKHHSPIDGVILSSLEALYEARRLNQEQNSIGRALHPLPGEVSFFAVKLSDKGSLFSIQRNLPALMSSAEAVIPAVEIKKLRFYGESVRIVFIVLIVVASAIGLLAMFLAISKGMSLREKDMQILHMLGMHKKQLQMVACLEPVLLIVIAIVVGYFMYVGLAMSSILWMPPVLDLSLSRIFEVMSSLLFILPLLLGQGVVLLVPALKSTRTQARQ